MKRPASLIAAILMLLIALGHLMRIIVGANFVVNAIEVPMWPSVVAMIFTLLLALWLLAERRSPTVPKSGV